MPRAQRTKSAVREALQRRARNGPGDGFSGLLGCPAHLLILASRVSQRHAASSHPKQRRVWRVHALHAAARKPRRGVLFRRAADPLPVQRATISCSRALVAEHRDSAAHYQGCDGRVFESPQNDKCEGCVGAHPFMRRPDAHASRACTFGQPNGLGVSCAAGPACRSRSGAAVAADDVRRTEWRTATAVTP